MKAELPSRRIAVLIDGGFFIKRFNHLYNSDGDKKTTKTKRKSTTRKKA